MESVAAPTREKPTMPSTARIAVIGVVAAVSFVALIVLGRQAPLGAGLLFGGLFIGGSAVGIAKFTYNRWRGNKNPALIEMAHDKIGTGKVWSGAAATTTGLVVGASTATASYALLPAAGFLAGETVTTKALNAFSTPIQTAKKFWEVATFLHKEWPELKFIIPVGIGIIVLFALPGAPWWAHGLYLGAAVLGGLVVWRGVRYLNAKAQGQTLQQADKDLADRQWHERLPWASSKAVKSSLVSIGAVAIFGGAVAISVACPHLWWLGYGIIGLEAAGAWHFLKPQSAAVASDGAIKVGKTAGVGLSWPFRKIWNCLV